MTVFSLKIIAMLSMIIDHIGYVLFLSCPGTGADITLLRTVGRIAFPIYAFLIVNGLEYSTNRKKYLLRLISFACLSQIPFSMAFTQQNYLFPLHSTAGMFSIQLRHPELLIVALIIGLIFYFVLFRRKLCASLFVLCAALILPLIRLQVLGFCLLSEHLNVFYTLAIGLGVIALTDELFSRRTYPAVQQAFLALAALLAVVCILPHSDYAYKGLLLIAVIYLLRRWRWAQVLGMFIWVLDMYSYSYPFLIGAGLGCLLLLFYRGKKGRDIRLPFYAVYPLHLLVLFFVGLSLSLKAINI